jgi:hypothetical protein
VVLYIDFHLLVGSEYFNDGSYFESANLEGGDKQLKDDVLVTVVLEVGGG